jgi:hypothetical protein
MPGNIKHEYFIELKQEETKEETKEDKKKENKKKPNKDEKIISVSVNKRKGKKMLTSV